MFTVKFDTYTASVNEPKHIGNVITGWGFTVETAIELRLKMIGMKKGDVIVVDGIVVTKQ